MHTRLQTNGSNISCVCVFVQKKCSLQSVNRDHTNTQAAKENVRQKSSQTFIWELLTHTCVHSSYLYICFLLSYYKLQPSRVHSVCTCVSVSVCICDTIMFFLFFILLFNFFSKSRWDGSQATQRDVLQTVTA